jgi:hypothetical protein
MRAFNFIINLFSSDRKSTDTKNSSTSEFLFIHEDDIKQIELSPAENFEYLIIEAERTRQFSMEHFNGTGWDDICVRQEPAVKLIDRNISVESFVEHFKETGFESKRLDLLDFLQHQHHILH